ncbi:MAG: D-alanyl-D-alanine carboxypeptidase family protein [Eubacteriales bacterium]|nr:D-alanyl-D-alanine carboxypeptidase family protein [Eubacteriales bacterium]
MRKHFFRAAAWLLAVCLFASPALAFTNYADAPEIAAKGCVVYEKNSGELLYSKGEDERLYPASTTKIMTALLLLEYGHLNDVVTASRTAITSVQPGSSIAGLKTGEKMKLSDLLICLLVPSGNDAANVIAETVGGSIEAFVDMMNAKAKALGCTGTHFVNAHGYHDDDHYTTASDLLKITLAAMQYPEFTEICGMAQASVPETNLCEARYFNSTNFMISNTETSAYLYSYCTGGKTGTTTEAGRCFVGFAQKGDLYLVSVMLGSTTEYTHSGIRRIMSFLDTEDLFDWAFSKFTYRTIISTSEPAAEVKVALSDGKDYVVLKPDHEVRRLLHASVELSRFTTSITLAEDVTAPVDRGDVLGTMTVYFDGSPIDTLRLLAAEDVELSQTLYMLQELQRVLHEPWVGWVIAALLLLVAAYIIFTIQHNRRMRKKLERRRRHRNIRH